MKDGTLGRQLASHIPCVTFIRVQQEKHGTVKNYGV